MGVTSLLRRVLKLFSSQMMMQNVEIIQEHDLDLQTCFVTKII